MAPVIVQRGSGEPLVLIPGAQGRWEYMKAAVDALAQHFRVVTFSLCDEPRSGFRDRAPTSYDPYILQVEAALDSLNLPDAVICGVSFGGRIALAYAARHPRRTRAL